MKRILISLVFVSFAHITTTPAQPLVSPHEQQSRSHFQRGEQLVAAGQFDAAYAEFEAGYELSPQPLFLFNMGECANQSNNVARARKSYLAYLQVAPNGIMAEQAKQRVAALPIVPVGDTPIERPLSLRVTRDPGDTQRMDLIETSSPTPLWKRWQVWTAVGALTAVAAVVVVVLTRDHDDEITTLDWRN